MLSASLHSFTLAGSEIFVLCPPSTRRDKETLSQKTPRRKAISRRRSPAFGRRRHRSFDLFFSFPTKNKKQKMAFRVVDVEEDVRLSPPDLARPLAEALTDSLSKTLVDRVVRDLGLIVAVIGVGAAEGGVVHAAGGDGSAHWRVAARLATFSPSAGDVLDGTVVEAGPELGLRVRLGRFFDDVLVPPDGLPSPSAFVARNDPPSDPASAAPRGGCWVYRPPPDEGEEEGDELEMGPGAAVRFRVREVRFVRGPAPSLPPGGGGKASAAASAAAAAAVPSSSDAPFAPLVVIGDMDGVGLGPKSWWADEDEDDEEGGAE